MRFSSYTADGADFYGAITDDGAISLSPEFPDRNAEYKDGSAQPKHMSLFPRFASGFTGQGQNLIRPPENHTLDYEGEVAIVIGKGGRRISQDDGYDHIAALTLCNEGIGTLRNGVEDEA